MSAVSSNSKSDQPQLVRGALEGALVPLFSLVLATLLVVFGLKVIGIDETATSNKVFTLAISGVYMLSPLLVLGVYLHYWRRVSLSALKLTRLNRGQLIMILKALGFYILLSLALLQLANLLTSTDLTQNQDLGLVEPSSSLEYGLIFLLLVVLTPITEEILFRGYMFRGFTKSWGWLPAAIISAGLFGLAHGQANVGIDTAAMGFVSAWLVYKTNSLTPSIVLHAAKNLVAFSLVYGSALLS